MSEMVSNLQDAIRVAYTITNSQKKESIYANNTTPYAPDGKNLNFQNLIAPSWSIYGFENSDLILKVFQVKQFMQIFV